MKQGSLEWWRARHGVITASRLRDVMGTPAAQARYAEELRLERAGDITPEDRYQASLEQKYKQTEWGHENEERAIAELEMALLEQGEDPLIERPAIVYHPEYEFLACSPDFIFGSKVGEVKSPYNEVRHITAFMGGMLPEHRPQVQGQVWITGKEGALFLSYDPRKPLSHRLFTQHIPAEGSYIVQMEQRVLQFWENCVLKGKDPQARDLMKTQLPF